MSVQLVVAAGSRAGQVIPIPGNRFVIGRADDCHLKPRSELISRYHCEIFLDDGEVFVRDMGSKNGVFLNEKQITETRELTNGDKLTIGPLEFFVHIASHRTEAAPAIPEPPPATVEPLSTIAEGTPAATETKPPKPPKVRSVSDAVARTVALQSENSEKSQEDSIADWLLAAGESGDELDTRTIDASELISALHAQSEEAANKEKEQEGDTAPHSVSGIRPGSAASSRDAASELLRKFFKGGK